MKRAELIFNLISIPVDAIALALAGLVSFYLRFESDRFFTGDILGPVQFQLTQPDFVWIMIQVIPVVLIIFGLLGLYSQRGIRRFLYEFSRLFIGVSLSMSIVMVLFFFYPAIFPSRFIILSSWVLGIIFLVIGRIVLKMIQQAMFRKEIGLHRLALINGSGTEAKIIKRILQDKRYGYYVVSEFHQSDNLIQELEELVDKDKIDEIVQTNSQSSPDENLKLMSFARRYGLGFSFVPNLFEVQRNVIDLNNLKGVPVISLKNTPLDGWGKVIKRIFDIIASLICILLTAPIFVALAIAVKLDSKGPVLYGARRVGLDNKEFTFYKIRSMFTHLSVGEKYGNQEAEQLLKELVDQNPDNRKGPLYKIKDDPRVTRVGRFLRKTKLDEIPQFWHVLFGDMSMVGPRPHLPDQVEEYKRTNGRVLSIKPGIFGLTQIAQITWPTLPFEEEIRLDTYYIENWSVWLDITILARSLFMLFWAKKPEDNY